MRTFLYYPWMNLFLVVLMAAGTAHGEEYRVEADLNCTNQPIQSDVVLVTNLDEGIVFECTVRMTPSPPEGYLPAPATYEWRIDSGELNVEGTRAIWRNMKPGMQRLQVSGTLHYLAPKPASFFSSQKPDIVQPFQAEVICLVPHVIDDLSTGFVHDFEVGYFPDPNNPADLENLSSASLANRVKQHADAYQQPRYFYEVTPDTYGLRIYEDYTLGEFDLDPRFSDLEYPRYIALHPDIIHKTVEFENVVREAGIPVTKLKIFYGFRSPKYNLGSMEDDGNTALKTPFSMHMYGKAIDFIIDEDNDLVMDDLNGDGKTTVADANVLLKLADQLDTRLMTTKPHLVGGAGPYYHHDYWERGEFAQSPYLHIDTRGFTAPGGRLIRWSAVDKIGVRNQDNPYRLKQAIPPYPFELP